MGELARLQLEVQKLKMENAALKKALMETIKNAKEILKRGD